MKVKMKILLFLVIIFLLIFSQEIRFRDVARELGINVSGGLGACCAFFDYNNDDYLDILFNPGERIYLFRNNYGINFTNVTDSAGLNNYEFRNLVIGDYNNDDYLDILANSHRGDCYLFRNNGDGTFTEVASSLGLPSNGSYRSIFLDYDLNGFLDVLIIGSEASYLYRQENNRFQRVHTFINGNTGIAFDYNNDFYPDIYIGRNGENKLYKNINGDTFIDVTNIAGVGNTGNTQGVVAGDFDNDGDLDIYLTNIGDDALNCLYVNQNNGTFINRTSFYGVGDVGDGRTCDIIDFNNDRLFDIFTTNHVYPNRLYRNMGYSAPFYNVAGLVNIASPQDIFAASWGDFDNDGDLDAFLVGHFGSGYALMRDSGGNYYHYLKVKLIGRESNRVGIGAKIYLFKNDTTQMIELSGGSGQNGHNPLIAHFGLGNNNSFDSLIVLWPRGKRNRILSLRADTLLMIIEPLTEIKDKVKLEKKEKMIGIYDVSGKKINNINKKGIYFILKGDGRKKLIRR